MNVTSHLTLKLPLCVMFVTVLSACTGSDGLDTPEVQDTGLTSQVISQSDAALDSQAWGNFRAYFTENSISTSANLVGVADIKAGQQIHPPHRHADEEYLMVTSGEGTWYVDGKTFPAKKGDILYAKPWDYHGIKAAPNSDLQFVVFKWSSKGVTLTDPNPSLPEELVE